ncbi:GIN domain-containing protein [Haliea sp.]|uniref:GIN domain-containing protein n=1 Tax=Haliea sp. TaxID=1932666 RepID=UPI003528B1C1
MLTVSSALYRRVCTLPAALARGAVPAICLLLGFPALGIAGDDRDVLRVTGLDIRQVEVQGQVDVEISQGTSTELLVRGASARLSPEPFHVRGQTLILGVPANSEQTTPGVQFKLTLPLLESLRVAGSGDVFVRALRVENFKLRVDGAGDVHLFALRGDSAEVFMRGDGDVQVAEVALQALQLRLSGAGDIFLGPLQAESIEAVVNGSGDIAATEGGRTTALSVTVVGSGDVDFSALTSSDVDVSVIGSGGVRLGPSARLNATIMGSGDIHYAGTPDVDENVIGSGELKQE